MALNLELLYYYKHQCEVHIIARWEVITISHNTWIHRFVEFAVRPLAKTTITPNHLTTARLSTGLAAAIMYAVGQDFWSYVASGVFVLSVILDRADGALARLSDKTSAWGHRYDLLSDTICNSLVFVGIGAGLREGALGFGAIPLGILAGLSITAVLFLVILAESHNGIRAAEIKGTKGFDPDDAILLVPSAMIMGWGEYLIVTAAIATPLFLIFFYWKFHKLFSTTDT